MKQSEKSNRIPKVFSDNEGEERNDVVSKGRKKWL